MLWQAIWVPSMEAYPRLSVWPAVGVCQRPSLDSEMQCTAPEQRAVELPCTAPGRTAAQCGVNIPEGPTASAFYVHMISLKEYAKILKMLLIHFARTYIF